MPCKLESWFERFNRDYFGGAIKATVHWLEVEGRYGEIGEWEGDGLKPGERLFIHINPTLCECDRLAQMTLLHEMAHARLWPNMKHGRIFQREMQRLAAAGAFRGLW